MKNQQLSVFCAGLMIIGLIGTTEAALISRLGGLAYYDTAANLTWLADANFAQTSGYDSDGLMTWSNANAWAASLTIGGVSGWRLADTRDVGNDGFTYQGGLIYTGIDAGYNMTNHSELSYLYYTVLDNLPYFDTDGNHAQPGYGLLNTGPFSNVQADRYWSATTYAPDTSRAWYFDMGAGTSGSGNQHSLFKYNLFRGWAVHSGDVSPAPVPAAVWLFGSGLLGLIGFAKKKI